MFRKPRLFLAKFAQILIVLTVVFSGRSSSNQSIKTAAILVEVGAEGIQFSRVPKFESLLLINGILKIFPPAPEALLELPHGLLTAFEAVIAEQVGAWAFTSAKLLFH